MSRRPGLIVVAGESLVDRIVAPDGSVETVPGGGPFTTARALGRLGERVAFLGAISTDRWGDVLRAQLAEAGVDVSLVQATDRPTLVASATLDPAGVAAYRFAPDASAAASLHLPDVRDALPVDTVALHVGTLGLVLEPTATTIDRLVATAPPGVLVMVDPNVRPEAIADDAAYRTRLERILGRADVVKASVDDLAWLDPTAAPVDVARAMLRRGDAGVAIVTDGPNPVAIVRRDGRAETVEVASPTQPVVDTVGAGDALGAGVLASLVEEGGVAALENDEAVRRAVELGVRVATWSVQRRGAHLPTADDLRDGGRHERPGHPAEPSASRGRERPVR